MLPYLIGIGELQRQASSVIKKIDGMHGGEGFIVSHNEPKAVLMSLRRYQMLTLLEEAKHLAENEILQLVEDGDKEFAAGKTRKAASLKDLL